MVEVVLESLTKRFGDIVAVDSIDLKVKDKELLVLLGPSGCGKTTTLRMIAGLETPTEGHVYIGDVLADDLTPKERDIAMVFQSYALYPHMTAFDNIAFPLKVRKLPKEEIKESVKGVAELLRISRLLDRKPGEISGGEAQRVALGRSIIREPKVFLMDEPLSNLDAKLRVAMRAELKRLQRKLGTTTIYVTHDQAEAMTIADRIAVMNIGKLQQVDTPDGVYHHPRNLFVAGFIGSPSMNFIEGSFVEKEEKAFFETSTFAIEVPEDIKEIVKEQATGSELTLGVRPEYITVYKKRKPRALEAEIYLTEPLGDKVIVDLKLGEDIIKAVAPTTFKADIGEKVWITFDMNRTHIFDRRLEKTII